MSLYGPCVDTGCSPNKERSNVAWQIYRDTLYFHIAEILLCLIKKHAKKKSQRTIFPNGEFCMNTEYGESKMKYSQQSIIWRISRYHSVHTTKMGKKGIFLFSFCMPIEEPKMQPYVIVARLFSKVSKFNYKILSILTLHLTFIILQITN